LNDPHTEPPVSILRNPITIAGAILTTISALLFITFMVLDLAGLEPNHYAGLAFVVTIPALFVGGLVIMPFGVWRERRRLHRGLPPSLRSWPRIDLNSTRTRAIAFAFVVLTPINILIVSMAGYKAVETTESVAFCGATCHTVMQPEYTAYQAGPHARVKCVECHVGEGAGWFIKAKLAGTRQLVALATGTYSRPVPSPVHNLRPATSTCEHCHWPAKFHGDKVEAIYDYADDEKNTETVTTLRLKIGGRDGAGNHGGIHWHVAAENQIEYVALDEKRQNIALVRRTTPEGGVVEYRAEGVTDADLAKATEKRTMDCIDCHNRPSHIFARSVERGVNGVISTGGAPKDLPFLKREAVAALKVNYATREEAGVAIERSLTEFYKKQYPDTWTKRQKDIERAVAGMKGLYERNIFPEMKMSWGFHPDNRGHMEFPGCFRCHDDNHKSKDGKVISQDCVLCHEVL